MTCGRDAVLPIAQVCALRRRDFGHDRMKPRPSQSLINPGGGYSPLTWPTWPTSSLRIVLSASGNRSPTLSRGHKNLRWAVGSMGAMARTLEIAYPFSRDGQRMRSDSVSHNFVRRIPSVHPCSPARTRSRGRLSQPGQSS